MEHVNDSFLLIIDTSLQSPYYLNITTWDRTHL